MLPYLVETGTCDLAAVIATATVLGLLVVVVSGVVMMT